MGRTRRTKYEYEYMGRGIRWRAKDGTATVTGMHASSLCGYASRSPSVGVAMAIRDALDPRHAPATVKRFSKEEIAALNAELRAKASCVKGPP